MTVYELTKMAKSGPMYRLIDATQTGYMSSPNTLLEADLNVVRRLYGEAKVVGFDAIGKNRIAVYVIAE